MVLDRRADRVEAIGFGPAPRVRGEPGNQDLLARGDPHILDERLVRRRPEEGLYRRLESNRFYVGAVDAAKLEASRKSGVPVPGVHSPLWVPEREPTLKAAISAETAILMDLLKGP